MISLTEGISFQVKEEDFGDKRVIITVGQQI
jgi:hypothetical protein